MTRKKHHGTSFEIFLAENGFLKEASLAVVKKVTAAAGHPASANQRDAAYRRLVRQIWLRVENPFEPT